MRAVMPMMAEPDVQAYPMTMMTVASVTAMMTMMPAPGESLTAEAESQHRHRNRHDGHDMS